MRKKHTPPPWAVGNDIIYSSAPDTIGNIVCRAPLNYEESMKAWPENAPLIAAAPELLAGCEWLIRQLQGESGTGDTHWETFSRYRRALRAIKKAKGEK